MLGRVINTIGEPIDGKGEIKGEKFEMPLGAQSPGGHLPPAGERTAADRHQADRRDDPIGRGQRELLIGDRQTGKTAIVHRHHLNQKEF